MSLVERALEKMQRSRERTPKIVVASDRQYDVGPGANAHESPKAGTKVRARTLPARRVVFNRVAIRAAGLLPPENQERQIADQYRQIKRPLIAAARKSGAGAKANANLIMVSSALAGDGKTFTAINLALSLANEQDFEIVLVDADVAKQHISRLLGIEDERGLMDALLDKDLDVESLILPTDVPGLSVLPAGQRCDSATELLASERMKEVTRDLAGHGATRLVVVDSPPLLQTNESRVLADSVGQVVIVVKSGKTVQLDLQEALGHLDPSRHLIGLVLNHCISESTGDYYGYGDGSQSAAAAKTE